MSDRLGRIRVLLSRTTNPNMAKFIGSEGYLEEKDGKFHFYFYKNGDNLDLSSSIYGKLGSLEHPRCGEVVYRTRNSFFTTCNIQSLGARSVLGFTRR